MEWNGKTVLVTGGSQGLGATMSRLFAEAGAQVIVNCAHHLEKAEAVAAKIRNAGGSAAVKRFDISREAEVQKAFAEIEEQYGGLDILVCNARIDPYKRPPELSDGDWFDAVIGVNLKGPYLCGLAALEQMKRRGGGRIVNVASIAGKVGGGYLGTAAYAAAKAGVISLTKSIAKAGSSKNIYCNSLCPAYTKTPLVSILTGEKEQKVLDAMSLHRAADPMEVASAVLFLASDAASFVQGENLNCDGGMLMNG